MTISVILVDDHKIVRAGIIKLLAGIEGISIIGEANTGEEAIQLSREKRPHVVLMDMKMPGIGGLEATKKILQHNPAIKIIALTSCTEEPYPSKVLKIGAAGYLSKETNLEEILLAIKTVCAGKTYICPAVAQKLALKSVQGEEFPIDQLSGRELQIMLMVAKGQEAKSIAQLLFLSPKTVNSYRYRVFKKLGVKGNVELTHFAARHGILDAELN